MHGFQLWANLPAARKMTKPRYQEVKAADIGLRAKTFLEQNPEVAAEIEAKIRSKAVVPGAIAATGGADEDANDGDDEGAPAPRPAGKGRG